MSLLARICTPLAAAALGVVALPAPAAQATHGCTGGIVAKIVANPYDPDPVTQIFPPIIDTTGTVEYAMYDVTVVGEAGTCVLSCLVDWVIALRYPPSNPMPDVQVTPPTVAYSLFPTYRYAQYAVGETGEAVYCTGYHDPA